MEETLYCFGIKREGDLLILKDPLVFSVEDSIVENFFKERGLNVTYRRGLLIVKGGKKEALNEFLEKIKVISPISGNEIVSIFSIEDKLLIKINKIYFNWREIKEDVRILLDSLKIPYDLDELIPQNKYEFFNSLGIEESEVNWANKEVSIKIKKLYYTFIIVKIKNSKKLEKIKKIALNLFNKSITIKFEKIELMNDGRSVKIKGSWQNKRVDIEMSILQLAKLWKKDKKVLKKLEENVHGNRELEDLCIETRKTIRKYPNIRVGKNKIKLRNISKYITANKIKVYGEDIVGWDNEGIRINFPLTKEILDSWLIKIVLFPRKVEIHVKERLI